MNYRKVIMKVITISMTMYSFTFNHVLSQNLVKNPGFETGSFSPYWTVWVGESSSVTIDANDVFTSKYSAKLTDTSAYLYQHIPLEPYSTYEASATLKSETGNMIYFGVRINSTGHSITFNNTTAVNETVIFETSDNTWDDPRIYVWKGDGNESVWADDFSLIKTGTTQIPGGLGTYYISSSGNDNNSGTSPAQSWKTIAKVNSVDFEPGDRVLFKGGEIFTGTIRLSQSDSGTSENKILVGTYEDGRAVINGANGPGFIATDCNFVVLKNLNFTGSGRTGGNTENGVTFSYCSNIEVDSLEISGFQHSGLLINGIGENYHLTNVHAHDNGYSGIYISGTNKTSLTGIYIGHCIAENNPGDPDVIENHSGNGIFGYNVTNMVIEYCRASNNGGYMPWNQNGPGGIWVAEADSVVIQFCISNNNKTPNGAKDGVGFDLDGGTTNSVIQYCLSYNNHGAGYGIYQYENATDWRNNTIRYCISENDGNVSAGGNVEIWNGTRISADFTGLQFYNNVIYNAYGKALNFIDHFNSDFNFRNNVFVSKSDIVYDKISEENFQGNNWYTLDNNTTQDSLNFITWAHNSIQEMLNGKIVGIYANPRFVNPGSSNITDPLLLSSVDDYKLKIESVLTDNGLDLESLFNISTGNRDYFGNHVKQGMAFNMGIDQWADKQVISLKAGWNIFSANLAPADLNLMNILQPLIDTGKLKKVMDEEGKTIEDRGIFGGWKNDIGNILNTEGYAINVTSSSEVEIIGSPVQLPVEVFLKKGWNIISWPAFTELDGMVVFQPHIDSGTLKKVMDEAGRTIEDRGIYGDWMNDIGSLVTGEGYKVNVAEDCTLTVDENNVKSQKLIQTTEKTVHFKPAYQGNGVNHMNFYLMDLPENLLNIGDELAIFDKEICVGAAQFQSHHLKSLAIPVIASASDNLGANGFTEGNTFILKVWNSQQKQESGLNASVLTGPSNFTKNGTTFISLKNSFITSLAETTGLKNTGINCYPNPFSNGLTVEIGLENDSRVQVEVLNQVGQLIKIIYPQNELNRGIHQISWNGENPSNQRVSAGIYLVRAIIGENVLFEKVICQ